MTPQKLSDFLRELVRHKLMYSTMIWGPPGIGKSSIVSQIAAEHGQDFVDVRLSQLAPTDLRGLPVPENGISRWFPPEFLPRDGKGILFLDEINMAPPAMQGMAQQLILDRRVGSYTVPPNWYIWAAGNRKEDRAAVFDMPAPLANRFLHLVVEPDFDSFKGYAMAKDLHEQIIAFLSFRPEILHKIDPQQPAWPSPRSWELASGLHKAGLDIAPAIGASATAEFEAYIAIYNNLPDIEQILLGQGKDLRFPGEPSQRYAVTVGLTMRSTEESYAMNAFRWLSDRAGAEWVQLFAADLMRLLRQRGKVGLLAILANSDPQFSRFFREFTDLITPVGSKV
jgi:hypothetical protein